MMLLGRRIEKESMNSLFLVVHDLILAIRFMSVRIVVY